MLLEIKDLRTFRYSVTEPHNVITYNIPPWLGRQLDMAITYEKLIEKHLTKLEQESKPTSFKQVSRNHLSALNGFLKTVKKTETSPVGTEMAGDFDAVVKLHLAESALSVRSCADRRTLLSAWRLTFEVAGVPAAPAPAAPPRMRPNASSVAINTNPFEAGLKSALKAAKLSPKSAARLARVSTGALSRWTRGALPNKRSVPTLFKLEKFFGLPDKTLLNLWTEAQAAMAPVATVASRERAGVQSVRPYVLKDADISDALRCEWTQYFQFKTVTKPSKLSRSLRGRWSLADASSNSTMPNAMNSVGNKVSPSANFCWSLFASYLGFLCLSRDEGGYGLAKSEVQTLAWLTVPEAIDAFLEFRTDRSGGLKHGGHRVFCSYVSSMVRVGNGYLTQLGDFSKKIPEEASVGRTWQEMCQETFELVAEWKRDAKDLSRDPTGPLKFFFYLEFFLKPVFDAMRSLRNRAEFAPSKSMEEAILRRDELVLGLLISNPLRATNLINLTYKEGGSGGIQKDQSGAWRIKIPGNQFKNRGRVAQEIYDVPVAGWLTDLVTDYVRDFRPVLLGSTPDKGYLFLSSKGGGRFNALNRQVFNVTKEHIPQCGGISPHAFRHLVATEWLTRNPNDFITVAALLNDTIEVIMKTYAHLKKATSFDRYEAYVIKMMCNGWSL